MINQKKQLKTFTTFVFVITLIFYSQTIFAQKDIVKTELTILDNNKLLVKVFNPKTQSKDLNFSFKRKIPNYYLKVDILKNIKNFKVFFKDGKYINSKISHNILVNEEFEYLEYEVILTTVDDQTFLPVSSYKKNDDYLILNFSTILGSFKEIDEIVDLRIISNNKLALLLKNEYDILLDRPLVFGFYNLNVKHSLPLISKVNNNSIIENSTLETYVTEVLKTIKEFEKFNIDVTPIEIRNKIYFNENDVRKMIFIFDSISSNTGAIAHNKNIVFHFNTNDKFIIQKTIIHELLHWMIPDQKSWVNESFAEYLALKIMLKNKLLSEREFFDKMSMKIKLADKYNNFSLLEIYKDPHKYEALYTKGVFYAWMLDIIVLKNTKYKFGIVEFILNPNSIDLDEREAIVTEFKKFEKEFIVDNKYISPNEFLFNIGILFEQNKLKEIKQKQTLVLKNINNKLVIKDFGKLKEFQINDKILSLNRKRKIRKINKKLYSMSNKKSRFLILRNGKKIVIKLDNKISIMRNYKYYLSFSEAKTSKQYWEHYINNL